MVPAPAVLVEASKSIAVPWHCGELEVKLASGAGCMIMGVVAIGLIQPFTLRNALMVCPLVRLFGMATNTLAAPDATVNV